MKKLFAVYLLALFLVACSDSSSDNTSNTPTNETNVESETNTATTDNSSNTTTTTSEPTEPESPVLKTIVDDIIANFTSWSSYVSHTAIIEQFENNEFYPNIEYNIEKQYIAEPISVYIATSTTGFSNMFYEQYADNAFIEGGYESIDKGEWVEMEPDAIEAALRNQMHSRAELLQFLVANSELVEEDNQISFIVDTSQLLEAYKKTQMTFFYNVTESELTPDIEGALFVDMGEVTSGIATLTLSNGELEQLELAFEYVNEAGEVNHVTVSEAYSLINEIDLVDSPEELYIGIGVN